MASKEPPEDDAEAVLQTLEESGVFDELRQQLLTQVRSSAKVKQAVQRAIASKPLPAPDSLKRTKDAACEQIRKELTNETMRLMLRTAWEEMSRPGGELKVDLDYETHAALCRVYEQREARKRARQT